MTYPGKTPIFNALSVHVREKCRSVLATLYHRADLTKVDDIQVIGRDEIIQLVLRHRARLPEAYAMRIGETKA